MIEIFYPDCSQSIGCFGNFKSAKGTLYILLNAGKLGENPAVFVCAYKNDVPQREYIATYSGGKWHIGRVSQNVKDSA